MTGILLTSVGEGAFVLFNEAFWVPSPRVTPVGTGWTTGVPLKSNAESWETQPETAKTAKTHASVFAHLATVLF